MNFSLVSENITLQSLHLWKY